MVNNEANTEYYKKLFFFKKIQTNNQDFTLKKKKSIRELKLKKIKTKLALSKILNHPHYKQRQLNYLDHFFQANTNESTAWFLDQNKLSENLFLQNPENLWNTLLGMKQDKLSRFYLINKYPTLRKESKWHNTRTSKFRRSKYDSFHINDLVLRTWIARQYSLGSYFNKEVKFFYFYAQEYLNFTKEITWYGKGFGTYVSSIKDAYSLITAEILLVIYKNKHFF